MGQPQVQTAVKLLAKAQSTTSDPEAIALVERSYGLLAQAITAYDLENDHGPRRRERRHLADRRRRDRAASTAGCGFELPVAPGRVAESIDRYRRAVADGFGTPRPGLDLVL